MSFSVSINPSFFLKKIDPCQVYEKYKNGKYSHLSLPESKEKKMEKHTSELFNKYEQNMENPIFIFKDKANYNQVVATSNCQKETTGSFICDWCRYPFKGERVGIPLKVEIEKGMPTIVHNEGCFCSFECCLSEVKWRRGVSFSYRDPLYMDSEQLLRYVYRLCYPKGEVLREAPDFRLLRNNGGSIDLDDFFSKTHKYVRTSQVLQNPVRVQYLKELIM